MVVSVAIMSRQEGASYSFETLIVPPFRVTMIMMTTTKYCCCCLTATDHVLLMEEEEPILVWIEPVAAGLILLLNTTVVTFFSCCYCNNHCPRAYLHTAAVALDLCLRRVVVSWSWAGAFVVFVGRKRRWRWDRMTDGRDDRRSFNVNKFN